MTENEQEGPKDNIDDDEVAFGMYKCDSSQIIDSGCTDDTDQVFSMKVQPYIVDLNVAGKSVQMELDTGASRSTLSEVTYNRLMPDVKLSDSKVKLRSYTNEIVPILGEIEVPVCYKNNEYNLKLIVVKGDRPALLGRDWLQFVKLDWSSIFKVECELPSSNRCPRKLSDL
jgi:hypothetical protein